MIGAATPLNVTALEPWRAPKFAPVIVTACPAGPLVGLIALTTGGVTTVKLMALLASPFAVTTTEPVVAATGTAATMLVSLHADTAADTPLNVILAEP